MGREDGGAGSEICKHFDVRFTKLVTFGPEPALGQQLQRTVNHEKRLMACWLEAVYSGM